MGWMVRLAMAKDRTRHARRRKPERTGVSLSDLVVWAMENIRYEFTDTTQRLERFTEVWNELQD